MKVKTLIEKLQRFPEDSEIIMEMQTGNDLSFWSLSPSPGFEKFDDGLHRVVLSWNNELDIIR